MISITFKVCFVGKSVIAEFVLQTPTQKQIFWIASTGIGL